MITGRSTSYGGGLRRVGPTAHARRAVVRIRLPHGRTSRLLKIIHSSWELNMKQSTHLLVGACLLVMAFAMLTSPALALRSLQGSNPGAAESTGTNISFEEEGGFLRTACSGVTLRGSLNERVAKSVGAAVGTITEARTTGCRAFGFVSATVTVEVEPGRPFRASYNSILGTLPTITGTLVLTEGIRFSVVAGGRTCRYEGRVGFLLTVAREARGALSFESGSTLAEPKMRLVAGSSESCPREGSIRGRLRFERTRTVTLV